MGNLLHVMKLGRAGRHRVHMCLIHYLRILLWLQCDLLHSPKGRIFILSWEWILVNVHCSLGSRAATALRGQVLDVCAGSWPDAVLVTRV